MFFCSRVSTASDIFLPSFQNIVPISLYISIEFVRTCQAAFIYFDADIWYEKTNQATLARTWNLSDDLGQIEYIFSDKTGTLTQVRSCIPVSLRMSNLLLYPAKNAMIFRQCSVGGKTYIGEPDPVTDESKEKTESKLNAARGSSADSSTAADSNTPNTTADTPLAATNDADENHFHSTQLTQDLADALHAENHSHNAAHARSLNGFFSVLALCHTVLTSTNKETGKITYKAQSPDEAALVKAAADVGYVFKGREREIMYLQKPSADPADAGGVVVEKYELLNILEFTSARKRMSVVLRQLDGEDGRLFLLTKGADNVIFERLKKGSDEGLKEMTEMHLSEFANGGLRTLTLAFKIIPGECCFHLSTVMTCSIFNHRG